MLLIDGSQVTFIDVGSRYLDSRKSPGHLRMLRSNNLIWLRSIHDNLVGEQPFAIDIRRLPPLRLEAI